MVNGKEIIEILNHVFGVGFVDENNPLSVNILNRSLLDLGVNLNNVIFSTYKEVGSRNISRLWR